MLGNEGFGFCGLRMKVFFGVAFLVERARFPAVAMISVASKNFAELTLAEREAILLLLEDEDPAVHELLVERLVSFGPPVLEWLLPLNLTHSVVRRRIERVQEILGRQQYDIEFLSYCIRSEAELDLEDGVWQFVLAEYPLVSVSGYRALVDSFAEVLQERLDGVTEGESVLATINQYLFDELGFSGNEENYYDLENSYLNRVIDRRVGIPISLSVLYLMLTRRLQLPVTGIGMPGHFLCRYQTPSDCFFIDVFNRGRLLSKSECIQFLQKTSFGYRDEYLAPVSARAILLRMCQNLLQVHSKREDKEQAARFQRYVTALSRAR